MRTFGLVFLFASFLAAACGSNTGAGPGNDDGGSSDASADAAGDAQQCNSLPPICDGCCGSKRDPVCVGGTWICGPLGGACMQCDASTPDGPAADAAGDGPTSDGSIPDAPLDDAPTDGPMCTGQAPLCFGSNTSSCCGNDPSGVAVCRGGAWMCGSAPAPGCNGTSCLQDASSD
jgi:hypothetical protein